MGVKKIRFRQSGGFGGLIRGGDVALADLGAKERKALESRIQKGLKGKPTASPMGARDLQGWEIEIETDEGKKKLEFDELSAPAGASSLIEWLEEHAGPLPLDD